MATAPGLRPQHDEYEITVFGPGYGECVVVHLGDNRWLTVDSCAREGSKQSMALEYFERLDVDPAKDVDYVVASHWHDDHVRGLAGLVDACESAQFVCSVALRTEEFMALVHETPIAPQTKFSSGVEEMAAVVEILGDRNAKVMWGAPSRRLVADPTPLTKGVWTLTPSDRDISRAITTFVAHSDSVQGLRRVAAWDDPNDATLVVLIEFDDERFLLGGDLEHRKTERDSGWHGVMTDGGRPTDTSGIFKVPHHGSSNAHCEAMWGHECHRHVNHEPAMLTPDSTISIIAPWRLGGRTLPSDDHLERLTELSEAVYLTEDPNTALGDPQHAARYQATRLARALLPLTQRPGGVTCRRRSGDEGWTVTTPL